MRESNTSILEVLAFVQQLVLALSSGNPNFDSGMASKEDITRLPMKDKKKKAQKVCGGMLRMLRSQPKGFEAFVADIYMNLFFFGLVKAFEKNGSYCKHHYNKQQYDQAL